ncbi:hypothetical protein [Roseovarius arcticus]|uniref:hypothetical protein n=1 Tax=Roseovarius arcticus TaxID=2547404 RepID=UPI001BB2D07F|nr:hypothetical protein [Roseovarius arcticus]
MPICEADPWRLQYFEGLPCPENVFIPTEDGDAWQWFPQHRWVYNKLRIAETQGFACGPHGIEPPSFPVFSKPIFNLRGMGTGSRPLRTLREYKSAQRPGHVWMPMFTGEHVSTDVAVVAGRARWWRHTVGEPIKDGMFDHWLVLAEQRPDIEAYGGNWIATHLPDYTGMLNIETIDAKIIEVHLRFADQWPDLYGGRDWVAALVALYAYGQWNFTDFNRRDGYSVVLFGGHGLQYRHPPQDLIDEITSEPGITSVQITFDEDRPASWHAMPPGGFRLAIVNCHNREAGFRAREKLAVSFWATQTLRSTRRRIGASPMPMRPPPEAHSNIE